MQQVWQELKDREWAARCRNQQLLQQFERSQDTLREMLARTVTMKTIRVDKHARNLFSFNRDAELAL